MSCFVVNYCELRACQHWRIDNKCIYDKRSIPESLQYVANIHDSSICEVRRQIDRHRLDNLLEDSK